MANPEHIKWLLEGVYSWNELRRTSYFRPDFEGADLPRIFQTMGQYEEFEEILLNGIDLSDANLVRTKFSFINLNGANFTNSDLRQACLEHTKLNDAVLHEANLADARLVGAKLNSANLLLANLTNANLERADITGVDLANTVITNANFANTQPWKRNLFLQKVSPAQYAEELPEIDSIACLLDAIERIATHHIETSQEDCGESVVLYFRGESQLGTESCPWVLKPLVMRRKSLRKNEGKMLRELISRRPAEFANMTYALDQTVLAQHYGLPTRFLDVSRNPLVALFNACRDDWDKHGRLHIFAVPESLIKPFNSDTVSIIANFAKLTKDEQDVILGKEMPDHKYALHHSAMLRLYQGVKQEKPYFEERLNIRHLYQVFVVEPQQSSERIRAQSGAFLASAFHDRFEPAKILARNAHIPIYAHYGLVIPKSCTKKGILHELQLLNVTAETLSPGLDESSKAIKEAYN